jgi:hypothetical protein
VPVVRNDCRNARLTSTPPKAPTAPAMPMSAPDMRSACRSAVAESSPAATRCWAWVRKIAGIIL